MIVNSVGITDIKYAKNQKIAEKMIKLIVVDAQLIKWSNIADVYFLSIEIIFIISSWKLYQQF